MFYNQPLSIRFGTELLKHIDHRRGIESYWDALDIAVAWVRASGMAYLSDNFTRFLGQGGQLSFVVGIDLQNTTQEGLQALLDLERHGSCETYVYHNEAGNIFHPKIYLFRNEEEARLIVGSNNLTASGLFANVEAGLQVDTVLTDHVITDAINALASWRDTTSSLAIRLDDCLLETLYAEGYVKSEVAVRPSTGNSRSRPDGGTPTKLFGSRSFNPPPRRPSTPQTTSTGATAPTTGSPVAAPIGTTVIMRLRKARGSQTQIPFRVAETFFKDTTLVESLHTGVVHTLNPAQAHGTPNTIKLEIPELRNFEDTYARFEKTPTGVLYEVHDVGSPKGDQIKASLEDGMTNGSTQTSIRDISRSTWWRYI